MKTILAFVLSLCLTPAFAQTLVERIKADPDLAARVAAYQKAHPVKKAPRPFVRTKVTTGAEALIAKRPSSEPTIPVIRSFNIAADLKNTRSISTNVSAAFRAKVATVRLGFAPAAAGDPPRPMSINLQPSSGGLATTVCIETVQGPTERLCDQYSTDLVSWTPCFFPIEPTGFQRNLGICINFWNTNLPPSLYIRIVTVP